MARRGNQAPVTAVGFSAGFPRIIITLGLACAQATTLCSQVFGKANPRSRVALYSLFSILCRLS